MLHYILLDIETSLDLLNDCFVFCSNTTEIPAIEPPPIKGYNNHMGGVDLSDQLIKCSEIIRKARNGGKLYFFILLM